MTTSFISNYIKTIPKMKHLYGFCLPVWYLMNIFIFKSIILPVIYVFNIHVFTATKMGWVQNFKILPLIVLTFEISASVSSTSSSIPSNLATACNGYSSATETPSVSSMGINTILARCNMAAKIRKITWICCKRTIRFS